MVGRWKERLYLILKVLGKEKKNIKENNFFIFNFTMKT